VIAIFNRLPVVQPVFLGCPALIGGRFLSRVDRVIGAVLP
jgi:hypothetical protein